MTVTPEDLPERVVLASREEFRDALRRAFAHLAAHGCREVWMCDEDFADWPLNEPGVIEHLTRWALPHRRLTVIARRFDELTRRHPRWVEWRRRWSEVVDCRTPEEGVVTAMPVLLVANNAMLVRLGNVSPYRGILSRELAEIVPSRETADALSQRSVPAFPATILGL